MTTERDLPGDCSHKEFFLVFHEIVITGVQPFHDGGRYHIETSPLICGTNQWTGFYMITASVMKGLNKDRVFTICSSCEYTHIAGSYLYVVCFSSQKQPVEVFYKKRC